MEAKELRIGNFVMCRNFPVFGHNIPMDWSVAQVSAEGIVIADKFEPIPITDEWLLKFGFKKGYNTYYSYLEIWDNLYIVINRSNTIYISDSTGLYGHALQVANFEYIHQLQNLFFALTGEELTIKS